MPDALTALYRHVLIPAFESGLKRRSTFRYWRTLEHTQWLTPEAIERLQVSSLRDLLTHAWTHCPYYKTSWRTLGLDPSGVRTLTDFTAWPVIDRATVRDNRPEMRAQLLGLRLMSKATGGSSGDPLQFDLDDDSNDRRMAAAHRAYQWAGAGPGTKQLYLWGTALGHQSAAARVKDSLYHGLYRRQMLSSFLLSDRNAQDYLARLNRRRPDVIVAYTNPLYVFARILQDRGLTPYSPRAVIVGAEALHDFQRQLIEEVFRAPVFETYGSREFMLLAAECERHEGLHITAEHILLEVLDEAGRPTPPGGEGRVVVTDLFNHGMPFIRYATGDRAVAGFNACSCGRGLALLRKVLGRQLDVLTTPDGRRVPGELFPHLLKDFPAVHGFQVVQESAREITLRLVLRGASHDLPRIEGAVRAIVGEAVSLRLEIVNDIPLTAAGKLQVVLNRVEPWADEPTCHPTGVR